MKTLQQIKDEYAKEQGYDDWQDKRNFSHQSTGSIFTIDIDEIAKQYAQQFIDDRQDYTMRCCKATLEKAAENYNRVVNGGGIFINEIHITKEDNIVLL